MKQTRKIIHIDMDAFYASVEQRDNPFLRGKPVVVGGQPDSRGVVATCSYEAREFGIHSAMASSKAYRLCPHAIFVRPRFEVYKMVSNQIRAIFSGYTDLIEPLSLDEAYLDVTVNKINQPSATYIAQQIQQQIYQQTHLTASAGVSYNKFLAKVASDIRKPNGITVIPPSKAKPFIDQLPINKFFGVGRVTAKRMTNLGIKTGADLKKLSQERLKELFGKTGEYYYNIAHGIDHRPVNNERIRKSIGKEITLDHDIDDIHEIYKILNELALKIENLLRRHDVKAKTITLKLKYFDFKSITRSHSISKPTESADQIMAIVKDLLTHTEAGITKVRLIGISTSNLVNNSDIENEYFQLEFQFSYE